MNESQHNSQRHNVERKKPDTTEYILCDAIDIMFIKDIIKLFRSGSYNYEKMGKTIKKMKDYGQHWGQGQNCTFECVAE